MKTSWFVLAIVVVLVTTTPGSGLSAAARAQANRGIVAMEFANDDVHGLRSFLAHGREFTHLHPRWLRLAEPWKGQLDEDIDQDVIVAASSFGLTIIPIIDNLDGAQARPEVVRQVLASPDQRTSFIRALTDLVVARRFGGLEIAFLDMTPADESLMTTFLEELSASLKPVGGKLVFSDFVHPADTVRIRELGNLSSKVDFIRVRIDGEHHSLTAPGPSASAGFLDATLAAVTQVIPREKLIASFSLIGHDWAAGQTPASETWYGQAMAVANARRGSLQWESETDSLVLTYEEGGMTHQAYFDDALTLGNKIRRVEAQGLAGVSFNRLGFEDPTFWAKLSRRDESGAMDALSKAEAPPFEVIGEGEVWDVVNATPRDGRREFTFDSSTGLISSIRYPELPAPLILDRTGVPPARKQIAITFDDGPSQEWTPKVLDLLSELHVPATFFVVGRHALGHRDLIRRIYNEGHDIGSHTFTHTALLDMSPLQAIFELNSTKYVIAGITGRTMRFIRSPFVANPNPRDEGPARTPGFFLSPQLRAREYGYLTVGNNLDPRDWERPGVAQIVVGATNRTLDPPGYIILLHDSGGDRTQTLRALPLIVDFYRSQGFEFTTVSGLLGQDRDFSMPPVRPQDAFATSFVAGSLNVVQLFETILLALLILSIGMGVTRTIGLLALAFIHYLRPRPRPFQAQEVQPLVSVLVPAYNEEKVIANTIDSLLRSNYRNYEVLVIDDGSKDGTLDVARRYEGHPRVRIIPKENGGKSSALNLGIQLARGEIVIAMDADTVFEPDFIPYILGHFRDPNVGAASGNAKVGNREDLIATFQSIEYITSFNLDRRAYTLLNCVTVVPGAAGAWRKRDLIAAGGFGHDTLAEDADLTVNVRRLGRRIVYEDRAIAWTEAPNTVKGFVKQRRRWSYGTLQVLAKHRDTFFRPKYGALGFVAFPSALLYLGLSLIAPAIDLGAMLSVANQLAEDFQLNRELPMSPAQVALSLVWNEGPKPLLYYLAFIGIEWVQSAISFFMDRERPWPLLWVPVQRFVQRWLMYYVLFATVITALKGLRVGWGKLERKGSVLGSAGAPHA